MTRVLPLLLLSALLLPSVAAVDAGEAKLLLLTNENWELERPSGKEADAIIGDVVLRNEHITAVIAQPLQSRQANMTVRDIAGCLIDLTVTARPNDQLSCYYPAGQEPRFSDWSFQIDDEPVENPNGQGGGRAEVTVTTGGDQPIQVTYRLDSSSRYLTVIQQGVGLSEKSDQIRFDTGKEDALKTPNGEGRLFWIDDRYWRQAYAWTIAEGEMTFRSYARSSTLNFRDQPDSRVLRLYVAENLCDIREELAKATRQPVGPLAFTVATPTQPLPGARVELTNSKGYVGSLLTDGSGRIDQVLPCGTYQLSVTRDGQTLLANMPIDIEPAINVYEHETSSDYGLLRTRIVNEAEESIPAKLALTAEGRDPLDFGPESAALGVKNLRYLSDGKDELLLPEGTYQAIVSYGPEHNAAFETFEVRPRELTELNVTLRRSVDTTGWISAEFHSHSTPSGDNTSSQLGRVLNLLCEQIEFAPCTEHNRIDSYADELEALRASHLLATCTGLELTGKPLPLNHQNTFPLEWKPGLQDGGAPLTDSDWETQVRRLTLWDKRSEKLIQQNHPDIGWLIYDRDGDSEVDSDFSGHYSLLHAIEIHPLAPFLTQLNGENSDNASHTRVSDWLQMQNDGIRLTGIVNTDAHYNFHGSGGFRNWIRCSTDDPAEIDTMEIVRATQAGHVVMSNGPFLEVGVVNPEDPASRWGLPGDEIAFQPGHQLLIDVQCPNWMKIDRVLVLKNGVPVDKWDFRRGDSEGFSDSTVQFKQTIPLDLKEDAHLVVIAAGENSQLGPVQGPANGKRPPIAIANPIFFDTDGNGFTPSREVLNGARPVKSK